MARGRMISKTLGSSRRFASLLVHCEPGKAEFAQALYPLLVSNADDWGRLEGDAQSVKWRIFPSADRSLQEFDEALAALSDAGLITHYSVQEKEIIEICGFSDHQTGLHKRTNSRFPQSELSTNRLASSPPVTLASAPADDDRVYRFLQDFAEAHQLYQQSTYKAHVVQQGKDLEAARILLSVYSDEQVEALVKGFLMAKWEADPILTRSKRTVVWLQNKSSVLEREFCQSKLPGRDGSPLFPERQSS